jgi:hypothetical protein
VGGGSRGQQQNRKGDEMSKDEQALWAIDEDTCAATFGIEERLAGYVVVFYDNDEYAMSVNYRTSDDTYEFECDGIVEIEAEVYSHAMEQLHAAVVGRPRPKPID